MIELLRKIQAALQANETLTVRVRPIDIYITPLITYIPDRVKFPCIGIKDGKIDHQYGASDSKDFELTVNLAIYDKVLNAEQALVGNAATGDPGILQLKLMVVDILENNSLGIAGIDWPGRIVSDPETKSYPMNTKDIILRKDLAMRWTKIEEQQLP